MDKYEFNIKVEQIKKLVNKSDYETAMKIADTIDWRRVRNVNILSMVAGIYEKNGEFQEAKDILLLAFERAPIGKRLLYKLADLALKEGNVEEAEDYYKEFCNLAADDPRQYILRYMILKAKGAELGITQPFQMFWATGFLSSFLDNTPTYLVFLTTAGSLGFTEGMQTILGTVPIAMLEAISCGAVFMGANTYIGNAPNFMVKAISDENGIKMPSFFGYLLWAVTFLVPVFILDMFVFFL